MKKKEECKKHKIGFILQDVNIEGKFYKKAMFCSNCKKIIGIE